MTIQRIVLACTGLEEGRDGVGDYCRKLAATLHAAGIDCALLALNDQLIEHHQSSALDGGATPVLRLPRRLPRREKLEAASKFIADFKPDVVSLQFVSYGFNRKGVVLPDIGWLSELFSPYRLELMCHEVWLGTEMHPTLKRRVVGTIQREAIRRLIARLKPAAVHTTNIRYASLYESIAVRAQLLPLFGAVPVTNTDGSGWVLPALRNQGFPDIANDRGRYWLFGMFGGTVLRWPFTGIFNRLSDIAQRENRIPALVAFGVIGAQPENIVAQWRASCPAMHFAWIGRQPAQAVSEIMNAVDFAISSHENYAIGKSSAAAAFLEHGVPVITNWGYDPNFPVVVEAPFDRLVWRDDDALEQRLLHPPVRTRMFDRADQIARRFLDDLQKIDTAPFIENR